MSNIATMTNKPKPQTSKNLLAANIQLLIEQLKAGHSEGLNAAHPLATDEDTTEDQAAECFGLEDQRRELTRKNVTGLED